MMKLLTTVTKEVEFDAGHRVPQHDSKCKHLHGHRYRVCVTLQGPIQSGQGNPESGMVIDFSHLKNAMMEEIHDPYDHRLILFEGDPLVSMFRSNTLDKAYDILNKSIVLVNFEPTAENLAAHFMRRMTTEIENRYPGKGVSVSQIEVYETPTSVATVYNVGHE